MKSAPTLTEDSQATGDAPQASQTNKEAAAEACQGSGRKPRWADIADEEEKTARGRSRTPPRVQDLEDQRKDAGERSRSRSKNNVLTDEQRHERRVSYIAGFKETPGYKAYFAER